MNKMHALIPARGGSKTIKKKNIQKIGGMPMVAHSILAAKRANEIEEVYVSSDSDEILELSEKYGAKPLKRPQEFAKDNSSTESVVSHFLGKVKTYHVVLIQPTSPMIRPEYLDAGIKKYCNGKYDSLFSGFKTNDMLIWDEQAMYPINYDPRNRHFRQTRNRYIVVENGMFFIFSRKMFVAINCRLGGKIGYVEVPYWSSFQVDDKVDLTNVNLLMSLKA